MVADPADYRWSSHSWNGLGHVNALVQHMGAIWPLLQPANAQTTIAASSWTPSPRGETVATRLNPQRQHVLGNERFRAAIERQLGRRVGPATRMGRPPKVRLTGEKSAP